MFDRKRPHPPQKRLDSLIGAGTTVDGDLLFTGGLRAKGTIRGHLELQAKARVHGNVQYRSLEMHVGAIVEGNLAHSEPETASVVELKRASRE